jgi:hypothetical protein
VHHGDHLILVAEVGAPGLRAIVTLGVAWSGVVSPVAAPFRFAVSRCRHPGVMERQKWRAQYQAAVDAVSVTAGLSPPGHDPRCRQIA